MKKVFNIAAIENYPQDVKAVRAREIKVEDVDSMRHKVSGEELVVEEDRILVHEAVMNHHHRQELRDH